MEVVYLSERNLRALLLKLERTKAGEDPSACTIIKYRNPNVAEYQQTMDSIAVVAVTDQQFYGKQQRPAGKMVEQEESMLNKPTTGVV